MSFMLTAFQW